MTHQGQGTLNQIGVNCLRFFPGVGTVIYGTRTLVDSDTNTAFQQWKYVPVRQMTLFIKQTLYHNLGWVVFEPNAEPLWAAIRTSIEGFMVSVPMQRYYSATLTEPEENQGSAIHIGSIDIQIATPHPVSPKL